MIGFCGKLPSHGDFLSRNLDKSFAQPWNEWLLNVLNVSNAQLGDFWLDHYLVSPIWRFALNPGVCGKNGMTGIMMPSVDSVGRYYPLTIACATNSNPTISLAEHEHWYQACERLALSTLEDNFSFEEFNSQINKLSALPSKRIKPSQNSHSLAPSSATAISLNYGPGPHVITDVYNALMDEQFQATHRNYALWWTSGSESVAATLLISEGLPAVGVYAALLDGNYQQWGWQQNQILQIKTSNPLAQVS